MKQELLSTSECRLKIVRPCSNEVHPHFSLSLSLLSRLNYLFGCGSINLVENLSALFVAKRFRTARRIVGYRQKLSYNIFQVRDGRALTSPLLNEVTVKANKSERDSEFRRWTSRKFSSLSALCLHCKVLELYGTSKLNLPSLPPSLANIYFL